MSQPTILYMPQYSPAWWEARCGIPTASSFDRIITPVRGKLSEQCDDYIAELIGDRVCLTPNAFTERGRMGTPEMEAGRIAEPEARKFYSMIREVDVDQVGFVISACGRFGCSPDGLVGEDGALELKCPLLKTQAGYLLKGGLPPEYKPQVHGQLIVTGRAWIDFLSYAPGLDPLLVRVEPDEYTAKLRNALEAFWERYQRAWELLTGKRDTPPAATPERPDSVDAFGREWPPEPDEYPLYDPMVDEAE